MSRSRQIYLLAAGLILICGLVFFAAIFGPGIYRILTDGAAATPDYEATLGSLVTQTTASNLPAITLTPPVSGDPTSRIVYTCQIYKYQSAEQICIMDADGSDRQQLTKEAGVRHFYPSISPDGLSVLYSQFRENNVYEIYELSLDDGTAKRLTDKLGVLTGPEVSPDGTTVAFMRWTPASDQYQIWLMDRDGGNPRRLLQESGWDPTWSPNGQQILFASDMDGSVQLYIVDLSGSNLDRISSLPSIRGRSDWSAGNLITTYSGEAWKREIFVMNADGSDVRQVSPSGGNSQGPSFSPDGQWIAFTAYFDHPGDDHGCEIYIMRTDGTDRLRLTDNDYCDYQPRWGP